jgi:hypothetical protein
LDAEKSLSDKLQIKYCQQMEMGLFEIGCC